MTKFNTNAYFSAHWGHNENLRHYHKKKQNLLSFLISQLPIKAHESHIDLFFLLKIKVKVNLSKKKMIKNL